MDMKRQINMCLFIIEFFIILLFTWDMYKGIIINHKVSKFLLLLKPLWNLAMQCNDCFTCNIHNYLGLVLHMQYGMILMHVQEPKFIFVIVLNPTFVLMTKQHSKL